MKMNERVKKSLIVVAAGGVLAGSLFGIERFYSAPEATTSEQKITMLAGDFEIKVTPNTNRSWAVQLPPLAAGDRVNTYVNLVNASTVNIGKLLVTPSTAGGLAIGDNPVKITLSGCSQEWTQEGTCGGAVLDLVDDALKAEERDITSVLSPNQVLYLKVDAFLPHNAGNEYQDKTGEVGYKFTAIQQLSESDFPKPS